MTYTKITSEGVKKYLPMFEASNYKYGHVSAQVDPRLITDTREMLRQGIGLKALAPNIMIKSPATKEGVYNMMLLTALGIPTNATVCFTLPQILAVAEAVRQGKAIGEANGVDYSQWRSVITLMLGRFEGAKEFKEQAAAAGVELTDEVLRWSGLAIAKKAIRILEQQGYESKLLLCSSRLGPVVDGKQKVWHIEKLAGEPVVYTINPEMIGDFLKLYEDEPIANHRGEEIPDEILAQLIKIPYFRQGYEAHGMTAEEFVNHPCSVSTAEGFAGDMGLLEEFVEKV
ncbi:MAG: transaldolase [Firmicutes bacterium]|nr:transaldolase [Bacillota bacterium]